MAGIVTLEFTDTQCKIVYGELGKNNKLSIRSIGAINLTHPEEESARISERAQAIKDYLKANKISEQDARIIIPKSCVMLRTAHLPTTVDEEIAGMAKFEAERNIPFNADRHIVSHAVLAKQGNQGSDVLLAAVDSPIAKEYLDIGLKAGLKVKSIGAATVALCNGFVAAEPTALSDRTVMVVNIGKTTTDLAIINNRIVSFARGVALGSDKLLADINEAAGENTWQLNDLQKLNAADPSEGLTAPSPTQNSYDELGEAEVDVDGNTLVNTFTVIKEPSEESSANPVQQAFELWLNRLLQEVRRTYEFASREFNCPPIQHFYLTGEGSTIKDISEFFRKNFIIEASVYDPLSAGEVSKKLLQSMREPSQLYAIAVGGMVGNITNTSHINLIPRQYLEERKAKAQQMGYIVTGSLVLVALVLGYFYLSMVFERKQVYLEELQAMNKKYKTEVDELTNKRNRLNIIRDVVQDDKGVLTVLEKISALDYIPEKVTLNTFNYRRGNNIEIEGWALDLPSANKFITDLRNTGLFEDGRLGNTNPGVTLRGLPQTPVMSWTAEFVFPKPKPQRKPAASSRANRGMEDEDL